MIGIYKITSPNGKIYIGQSVNINKRFRQYKNLHCKFQTRLNNSLKKYGINNHIFEVVVLCEKDELNKLERYYQDLYDCIGKNGLNCILTNSGDRRAERSQETIKKQIATIKANYKPYSEERLKKMSESLKGVKNPMYGKTGEKNPFFGRKHTIETKKIISKKNSGINNFFYGKKRPEHSKNMKGENHFNFGKKCKYTSIMNSKRIGLLNSRSKILLDTNTGVYYYGDIDFAKVNNIDKSTFKYKRKKGLYPNLITT